MDDYDNNYDDYCPGRWGQVTYGGISDKWDKNAGSMSHKELAEILRSYHPDEKEELKLRVRDLELEVHRLRAKAKKKEEEFKEFRKLRKAIKADSINTKMARLVKRI